MPGVAKVVSVSVGHSDQGLDGVNVLLLHLCDAGRGCQQGEPGQSLDVCIPFQLQKSHEVSYLLHGHSVIIGKTADLTTYTRAQTCMLKMQAILMAHRMPSRHSEATSGSSQSCSPTLNAASRGVHAS